jgi:hypothetical protein
MGKAQRLKHRMKTVAREWTAWQEMPITDEIRESVPHMEHASKLWANSRFEIVGYECPTTLGGVWQLLLIRHGHIEPILFDDCLRVKNELFGVDSLAVEIYPRGADRSSKTRLLWILPQGASLPYGLDVPGAWGEPI